ncbi:MAG: hypothetical protein AABO41_12650 [Acidobacteriota bacterium]
MTSGYMVVARDGLAYGPLDRDTIQQWYFEGRIDRNSKVCEPGKPKFRLHEMFDLTLWRAALVNTAPPGAPPTLSFQPKTMADVMAQENERTPGMVAAGILLAINGVLGLLIIAVLLLFKLGTPGDPGTFFVPIVDLIVAVGLLRGKERFRRWGMVRAVLGGGLFLVRGLFAPPTALGWADIFFQLVFCAGIVALLVAESPARLQVGIGVAAVLVAWSGSFTTFVVVSLVSGMNELQSAKYAEPEAGSVLEAGFEDLELGVKARLPPGWALITKDSPIPEATLVASHARSGCGAALIAEPVLVEVQSLDEYLSRVLQARLKEAPDLKETGRADVNLGGNAARTVETSWTSEGQKLRGFTTACKSGWRYYLLTGWCLDEDYSRAFAQYKTLAGAFQIDGGKPLTEETRSEKPSRKRRASKK